MPKKEKDPMVLARKALSGFWENALLRGRCWGRKKDGQNPFCGSNITLAVHNEAVSISLNPKGKLVIHEFKRVKVGTTLFGREIKAALLKKNLPIV